MNDIPSKSDMKSKLTHVLYHKHDIIEPLFDLNDEQAIELAKQILSEQPYNNEYWLYDSNHYPVARFELKEQLF